MKGIVGNAVSLTLMDDKTNLVQQDIEVRVAEWAWYTVGLKSPVDSQAGKVKINFIDSGIYNIDALRVKEGGSAIWYVSPDGKDSVTSNNDWG